MFYNIAWKGTDLIFFVLDHLETAKIKYFMELELTMKLASSDFLDDYYIKNPSRHKKTPATVVYSIISTLHIRGCSVTSLDVTKMEGWKNRKWLTNFRITTKSSYRWNLCDETDIRYSMIVAVVHCPGNTRNKVQSNDILHSALPNSAKQLWRNIAFGEMFPVTNRKFQKI